MKILAFEFSTRWRSVAALDTAAGAGRGGGVAGEAESRATPVFTLIGRALGCAGIEPAQIERLAVGLGPGSATGIRAAIAVMQGWHLARGVEVVGCSSLEVLAAGLQQAGRRGRVWLATDAQREEFHLAGYELDDSGHRLVEPLHLVSRAAIEALVGSGASVLGPGMPERVEGAEQAHPEALVLAHLAARCHLATAPERLEAIHLRTPTFTRFIPSTPPIG